MTDSGQVAQDSAHAKDAVRSWWSRSWALVIALVVSILAVVAVDTWTGAPHIRHTSALNAVFDDRLLIAASRVLLAALFGYLLLSNTIADLRERLSRSLEDQQGWLATTNEPREPGDAARSEPETDS